MTGWFNAELWGDWSESEGFRIQGVSDLKDARLVSNYQDLAIDRVNMRFNWHFQEKGRWRLDIADFLYEDDKVSWTAPNISLARNIPQDVGLWISADWLPLGFSLDVTRDIMSIYKSEWPSFLPPAISGQVDDLELILNKSWQPDFARGFLSGFGVSESDRWPGVQGLDAVVALQHGSGSIALTGSEVLLDWPRMFRERLQFTMPACHVDFSWGRQWQAGLDDCSLENEDLAIAGRGVIASTKTNLPLMPALLLSRGTIGGLGLLLAGSAYERSHRGLVTQRAWWKVRSLVARPRYMVIWTTGRSGMVKAVLKPWRKFATGCWITWMAGLQPGRVDAVGPIS